MSYIEITNFKYGLDNRKGIMTANPGSLVTLQNAWVNQGGEVEKRRAFLGSQLEASAGQTYGCEFEANGAVVFGSSSQPVQGYIDANLVAASTIASSTARIAQELLNWLRAANTIAGTHWVVARAGSALTVTNSLGGTVGNITITRTITSTSGTITFTNNGTATVTVTVGGTWAVGDLISHISIAGAGVPETIDFGSDYINTNQFAAYPNFTVTTIPRSYQRLVVPNPQYDGTDATLSAVSHSCLFDGKCFVIATFSDGKTWLYYNGAVLGDNYLGWIYGILVGSSNAVLNAIRDSFVASASTETSSDYVFATTATLGRYQITRTDGGNIIIVTAVNTSAAGTITLAGSGTATVTVTFGGTWVSGDKFTNKLTDAAGGIQYVGYGAGITGLGTLQGSTPTFCSTFVNKVYLLAGTYSYISEVGSATRFNNVSGTGNGNINMAAFDGIPDTLLCTVPYQGRLAFFFRNSVQIWAVASALASYSLTQTLKNTGAVSKLAVVPLGDLDVLYVSDSGVRSLRVRDASLNATVTDVGSPIDEDIKAALIATGAQISLTNCGYEPLDGQVWVQIYNNASGISVPTMWALSYYPSVKIQAWAKFDFSIDNVGTLQPMNCEKFMIWRGAVYARGKYYSALVYQDDIIQYYSPTVYDSVTATVETPWLSSAKPGTNKMGRAVDIAGAGKWTIKTGMDPVGGTLDQSSSMGSTTAPNAAVDSTFPYLSFPVQMQGTHFKLQAVSNISKRAVLSSFVFHYTDQNAKP
jgi:hypothetical protein